MKVYLASPDEKREKSFGNERVFDSLAKAKAYIEALRHNEPFAWEESEDGSWFAGDDWIFTFEVE